MAESNSSLHSFNVKSTKLSPTGITLYEISYSAGAGVGTEDCGDGDNAIWRRYSELRDLYKSLSKSYPGVELSGLPKGSYLDRFKQEVIESRKQNIQQLLHGISQSKELLGSKVFANFLTQRTRISSFTDKFTLPKIRHSTISETNLNPLFSEESDVKKNERRHTYAVGPTNSLIKQSIQESCVQDYDMSNSTDANSAKLNSSSFSNPERELQGSSNSSQLIDTYISPYQSLSYGQESEGEMDSIPSNHEDFIRSIGSGSDESYQAELEFDSMNPLLIDPLLQPMSSNISPENNTPDMTSNYENIAAKPSAESIDSLLLQDPLIQYHNEPLNSEVNSELIAVDLSMVQIDYDSNSDRKVKSEPEWWENAANETEDALKQLEQQTKRASIKNSPIHSVYETLPLLVNNVTDTMDNNIAPNPVNISNSDENAMDGFEGVTKGGELYSSGIELCKQGKLEEGLTMLENGIELFFCASRNVNLDANYRKKLRGSLKKYLTYAEQVKTQLNEINLQKSNNFPSEHSESKQTFKTPITLDELKVTGIVNNKLMLVKSSKTADPMQKPFLLKSIQKNKINFADPRHRHIKMSRNSLPSYPHPNIVQLLGSVQSSHLIYLMLEYVEGRDLHQIAANHTKGDFLQSNGDSFIRWTSQLISTLEELHLFGIFYLHLCPWDIIVQEDNSIKLTYPVRWEDTPDRLQFPSNIPYIAPECIHPISPVYSESADWWSLGAVCYELVTGRGLMFAHGEGFSEGKSIYFPQHCFSQSTLDKSYVISLITQLLTYNYTERMQFVNKIKLHPIFSNVDWSRLRTSKFSMQSSQESHF